jgi:hypothetical protein
MASWFSFLHLFLPGLIKFHFGVNYSNYKNPFVLVVQVGHRSVFSDKFSRMYLLLEIDMHLSRVRDLPRYSARYWVLYYHNKCHHSFRDLSSSKQLYTYIQKKLNWLSSTYAMFLGMLVVESLVSFLRSTARR